MADLVNISPHPDGAQASQGVFLTGQSVLTFPAASTLVTFVWKVLGSVQTSLGNNKWIPLVLALLLGLLIYWQSENPAQDKKGRVIGFLFALLNSFTLAAAALGIDAAVSS